jgi:hypothetical protein
MGTPAKITDPKMENSGSPEKKEDPGPYFENSAARIQ